MTIGYFKPPSIWFSFYLILLAIGCRQDPNLKYIDSPYSLDIPKGITPPNIPAENTLTTLRIQLGRELFYDSSLSLDYSVSCATCHLQEFAFTNNQQKGIGIHGIIGKRNVPTLTNIAYSPKMFADGGSFSLEAQVFAPLQDSSEFSLEMTALIERLSTNDHYRQLSHAAYQRPIDAFVITSAIASFERTLISFNSKYDQYLLGGDKNALNESELKGMALFFSQKTNCGDCHAGINLTDYTYQNIGLYENYDDPGRARITLDVSDEGKFRVPTLRNIELTGPYMHDGSINSLEEAVEHFDKGGRGHSNQSDLIRPLFLSDQEKMDLVSFLKSLTDVQFLNDPSFGGDN